MSDQFPATEAAHEVASKHMASLDKVIQELCRRYGSVQVFDVALTIRLADLQRTQNVANRLRGEMGLPPLDPPNVITGYQRR